MSGFELPPASSPEPSKSEQFDLPPSFELTENPASEVAEIQQFATKRKERFLEAEKNEALQKPIEILELQAVDAEINALKSRELNNLDLTNLEITQSGRDKQINNYSNIQDRTERAERIKKEQKNDNLSETQESSDNSLDRIQVNQLEKSLKQDPKKVETLKREKRSEFEKQNPDIEVTADLEQKFEEEAKQEVLDARVAEHDDAQADARLGRFFDGISEADQVQVLQKYDVEKLSDITKLSTEDFQKFAADLANLKGISATEMLVDLDKECSNLRLVSFDFRKILEKIDENPELAEQAEAAIKNGNFVEFREMVFSEYLSEDEMMERSDLQETQKKAQARFEKLHEEKQPEAEIPKELVGLAAKDRKKFETVFGEENPEAMQAALSQMHTLGIPPGKFEVVETDETGVYELTAKLNDSKDESIQLADAVFTQTGKTRFEVDGKEIDECKNQTEFEERFEEIKSSLFVQSIYREVTSGGVAFTNEAKNFITSNAFAKEIGELLNRDLTFANNELTRKDDAKFVLTKLSGVDEKTAQQLSEIAAGKTDTWGKWIAIIDRKQSEEGSTEENPEKTQMAVMKNKGVFDKIKKYFS